jgi:hypothetical protein
VGLTYNAVSNGGTDFLPQPHRGVIDVLMTRVLREIAGISPV